MSDTRELLERAAPAHIRPYNAEDRRNRTARLRRRRTTTIASCAALLVAVVVLGVGVLPRQTVLLQPADRPVDAPPPEQQQVSPALSRSGRLHVTGYADPHAAAAGEPVRFVYTNVGESDAIFHEWLVLQRWTPRGWLSVQQWPTPDGPGVHIQTLVLGIWHAGATHEDTVDTNNLTPGWHRVSRAFSEPGAESEARRYTISIPFYVQEQQ